MEVTVQWLDLVNFMITQDHTLRGTDSSSAVEPDVASRSVTSRSAASRSTLPMSISGSS